MRSRYFGRNNHCQVKTDVLIEVFVCAVDPDCKEYLQTYCTSRCNMTCVFCSVGGLHVTTGATRPKNSCRVPDCDILHHSKLDGLGTRHWCEELIAFDWCLP